MVAAAIDVADTGMAAGELSIGAVIVMGDDIVARSHTRERGIGRRLVHADLLAMIAADERLGFAKRPGPLALAVNLEPCVMCLGAAMTLGVAEVFYALESPGDGGAVIAAQWRTARTRRFPGADDDRWDPPGAGARPVRALLCGSTRLRLQDLGAHA
jgi:tRNA(adenine34) deaminase